MSAKDFTEADLSGPVREYFTGLGYNVRSEVNGCDLAAENDSELVVVELKKGFNLKLVYQALERMAVTDQVYVAIPRPKRNNTPEYAGMIKLIKRLELGLITVAMDSPVHTVDVLLFPEAHPKQRQNVRRRASVLKELNGRLMDLNNGGSSRTKIMTAYRERCIKIACILKCRGPKKPKELVVDYGCENDAGVILRRNFDGWFERLSKGVYGISECGLKSLSSPNELAEYYLRLYR